jgi:hypothetical protein
MMRLYEFELTSGEEARTKRLKDNAKNAKDRAKQLSAQADVSANQLKAKKAKLKAAAVAKPVPAMPGKPGWEH